MSADNPIYARVRKCGACAGAGGHELFGWRATCENCIGCGCVLVRPLELVQGVVQTCDPQDAALHRRPDQEPR